MRLADLTEGDMVHTDNHFDCLDHGHHRVHRDDEGLFVICAEGKHYLDGQIGKDGHLVGFDPVFSS